MAWENQPQNWSLNAVYETTRILSFTTKAQSFYKLVLLPRVRDYISKYQELHYLLFQSLGRASLVPQAFFDGIVFPLCESGTCTVREAVYVGSILEGIFIPPLVHSSALSKLASMEHSGTISYFIKILLEKEPDLPDPNPDPAVNALMDHFMKFLTETRQLPVLWHRTLLAFVHRYKNQLQDQDKDRLMVLLQKHESQSAGLRDIINELNDI
ncbi:bystin-like [Arachis ipaensis]|uniref:bystin-like n=1 Tax=Arachis ipaensis TaxID=130454 RepID=UPI0007AFD466|nr:bystin-like [Arachis ipaensis]XP_025635231.1 bystin-like [Arachis hypogaea]